MLISELIKGRDILEIKNEINIDIQNLTFDSRERLNNSMFFCIKGTHSDGHDFVLEALENGAVCVVCEKKLDIEIMQIVVKNVREFMAYASAKFYDFEHCTAKFIGITGTNGKTTTTFLIKHILEGMGKTVGLIGTEGCFVGDRQVREAELTTPDSIKLFQIISEMKVDFIVMEVSAHSLDQKKVLPIDFAVSALTNITQDHLDYFGSMEMYIRAKEMLFAIDMSNICLVNIDDENANIVYDKICNAKLCLSSDKIADYNITQITSDINGSSAVLTHNAKNYYMYTSLIGDYNLYNVTMAVIICHQLGFDLQKLCDYIANKDVTIPGRFNVIKKKNYSVVIDFAHTPDGVEKILSTLKKIGKNRLIVIFGCGGNRDVTKRPIMASVVSEYADYIIITSDNPRYEDPDLIISDVEKGIKITNYEKISDRRKAIIKALDIAQKDDIVAILGKGNENYQVFYNIKVPYCDVDVVNEYKE